MNNYIKTINSVLFILNTIYIFGIEFLMYVYYRDYSTFINNVAVRLSSINILYVKIFQAVAYNNSLIDEQTNNELLKFTDNAPWCYNDINLLELINIVKKYNLILKQGYEIPINSGMISLVFKAYTKDNKQPVIIKMKRANIEITLNDAIEKMLFLIYILSFIPIINNYQIAEVVNKNISFIKHQTNFLEEIDNMNKIRENCKNLKYVKIPIANRSVTEHNPNFILMEYIEGVKINQIKEEYDYEMFAKIVIKFGIVTTIIHGTTHGDLHGGNILFIKDKNDPEYPYKIGVIDFGIIYEVEQNYKGLLFDVFTNMFENTSRETAEKMLNSGLFHPPGIFQKIPKKDYNNIVTITEEILDEVLHASKKANQIQIYKFMSKLKEIVSKEEFINLGIRPSDEFVKSQMVLAMAHGVTLSLCNKCDFIQLMDKVINELFSINILLNN